MNNQANNPGPRLGGPYDTERAPLYVAHLAHALNVEPCPEKVSQALDGLTLWQLGDVIDNHDNPGWTLSA
jgi:hypothetical protein